MAIDPRWLEVMQGKGLVGNIPARQKQSVKSNDAKPIEIELPLPPTSNNLFPTGRNGKRFISPEYREWKKVAADKLNNVQAWKGEYPVRITIVVVRGKGWKESSDIANREKATVDSLVQNGIIEADDCLHVRPLVMDYDPTGSRKNPPYVRVRIERNNKVKP